MKKIAGMIVVAGLLVAGSADELKFKLDANIEKIDGGFKITKTYVIPDKDIDVREEVDKSLNRVVTTTVGAGILKETLIVSAVTGTPISATVTTYAEGLDCTPGEVTPVIFASLCVKKDK